MMNETKRNRINLWMFPLGTVGRDMLYSLFNSFLFTYVLFTRSLTAAQLSASQSSWWLRASLTLLTIPSWAIS